MTLLKQGQAIETPIYDFTVYNRSETTNHVMAGDVIIFGILGLALEEIRQLSSIKYADIIVPYYEGNEIAIDMIATKIKTLLTEQGNKN